MRWLVWLPTLAQGWRSGEAALLRGCRLGKPGGCSCLSPHCPFPGASMSVAPLGPCAPAVQPAPHGSGCGPAGWGWGRKAELLCLQVLLGAGPDPAGLWTGCEGQAAVSGRPGCLWSAACWAVPSGCQCLCRHCGHQGAHSVLRRLRSHCRRSSGGSGEEGAADPGAWGRGIRERWGITGVQKGQGEDQQGR